MVEIGFNGTLPYSIVLIESMAGILEKTSIE
jgi:hypothetical protein